MTSFIIIAKIRDLLSLEFFLGSIILASKALKRWEIVIGKYLSFWYNVALKFLGIGLIETKIFFSYVMVLVLKIPVKFWLRQP